MLRHEFSYLALATIAALLAACASGPMSPAEDAADGPPPPHPEVADDQATLIEGEVTTLDLLQNDPTADPTTMTVTLITPPAHADAIVLGSGALSIAARFGFNGPDALRYSVTNSLGEVATAEVRLTIYAAADEGAPQVLLPDPGLRADQLGVLVNDADPQSVAVADHFVAARQIPAEHVVHLDFPPGEVALSPADFEPLRDQAQAAVPDEIQAWAITWTTPYRVGCVSITSAFAMGYDPDVCDKMGQNCTPPTPGLLYNTLEARPWTELGVRPAMMIAGKTTAEAIALIDRGLAADGTAPTGVVAMVRTSDVARSVRWPSMLGALGDWQHPDGLLLTYVDNADGAAEDWVADQPGLVAYFTGLIEVPHLASNTYLPGAVADHLTSFGGQLTDSSQMSALRWLEAGATASYGAVVEPCNATAKFPDPRVLLRHYVGGATVLEAYWRSVIAPWEGIFIGEPLASPWGRVELRFEAGDLSVTSTWPSPRRAFAIEAADTEEGPFEEVLPAFVAAAYGTSVVVVPDADRAVYRLAPRALDQVDRGR